MFIKGDSSFSVFISELRKLEGREKVIKALAERRKMLECDNRTLEQANVLKMIYFAINQQDIDTMLFIKAIGSKELNTKRYGYLGLLLSDDEEYFILMPNTIMKDLQNKRTREIALSFLCNVKTSNNIFHDLSNYICTRNNNDKFISKSTIAKSKIAENERISLIGNSENLILTKIQIIIDKMIMNEDVILMENDKSFLYAYYATTSNSFLKVKLIQFYKLLNEKNKLNLSKNFFQCLEKDIILPHESIKPLIDIALSIEIVDLFLSLSNATQKVESFLFRLIDSQNPNSRYMGFNLAMKYKLFCNQVIDKAIKYGVHNSVCYEALMFFINKSTHKEIYKRKEEIRFILDKLFVKVSEAKKIVNNIILKILEHAKDEFYIKIYYENPEICFIKEFDRTITDELKLIYFNKLLQKTKTKYFYFLYCLMPKNCDKPEFYDELFQNHLEILVNSKTKKGPRILERLIMAYLYFNNLDFYRNTLVKKYFEVASEFKQVIKDGICLMNVKCNDKTFVLEPSIVLKYNLSGSSLIIKIKGNVERVEVKNKKECIKRKNSFVENGFNVFEYEIPITQSAALTFISKNKKYSQNLYPYQN